MIVTMELQVADTPCLATINTATRTVVEVTTGYEPAFADLKAAQTMESEQRAPSEIQDVTGWFRDEAGAWTHDPSQRKRAAKPVIAQGRRSISRDPVMDESIITLWAAGRLKEAA
jgi:hypothetical protein